MPHLPITTYNSGNPPGIDAPWLDALGAQVEYVYSTYFITPYMLENNTTITSGSTVTHTCTGVGGVPSGAKGILANLWFLGSALGTYATVTPHGTAEVTANYPAVGTCQNTSYYNTGSFIAVLDGSGKIDVSAVGGNLMGLYLQMYGYIY